MENKMNFFRRIAAALLSILLAEALFAVVPDSAHWSPDRLESEGFTLYSRTKELELYLDRNRAVFAVRKISSGYVWYSSPLDWEEDDHASGYNKNAMPSMLQINTKDKAGSFFPANSYVNAVKRKGFKVEREDGGFTLNHNFVRDGIFIPLHVTVEGNSLVVSVNFNEIEEEEEDPDSTLGSLRLLDFTLLPYFGAAPAGEDGYMFVPDGTGAVIKFDNTRGSSGYSAYVYGRDESIIPSMKKTVTEDIYLPVFGMSRGEAGFVAVIEDNRSNAVIEAQTAGQVTTYNNIASRCIVRDLDTFTFRERTGTPRDIRIFQTRNLPESGETYSVRYIFLDGSENSYTGMAGAYRKYLQEKSLFPQEKTDRSFSMALNFIGSGSKKKAVLGIPKSVEIPYTPFDDVETVIESLKERGVGDFVVKYDGWIDGGIFGKYPASPSPEPKLGGNRGFNRLLGYLDENGIDFYGGADFVNLYRSDLGHIKELNANREINKSPVKVPDFRMSTFDEKTGSDTYPNWILRLSSVKKGVAKFLAGADKKYPEIGLAPDSLGNIVGSDFGKNGNSRDATADGFSLLLDDVQSSHPVLLSRPFDYALKNVSYITDVPAVSSSYDIEDYSVPFYQILLRGYIPFANFPANRAVDTKVYKLQLLETGSDISYLWITRNQEELRDSRLQSYMSVYAEDWLDEAAAIYTEIKPVADRISGRTIKSHEVYGNGGRITVYDNGVRILTNYSDKTITAGGMTAGPYSWAVSEDR